MSDTQPTNLYTALLAAQRVMGKVIKNATNPHLKSKYADLGSVLDTIEQPLWDNGLLIVQRFTHDQGGAILVTELIHAASGERIASEVPVVSKDPTDPQKIGAAITYYRRYSLLALLGLSPEDDDGHAASLPRPADRQRGSFGIPDYADPPTNHPVNQSAPPRRTPPPPSDLRPAAAPIAAAGSPTPLTEEQERVLVQVKEMAEAKETYGATKALVQTLEIAATDEQWTEIRRRWFKVRQAHYPLTIKQVAEQAG